MKYIRAVSAVAAQREGYPAGGLGDSWAQDQPSSIGITRSYDPNTGPYIIPHSGGRTTPPLRQYPISRRC
jgi:hypothetical protein